MICNKSFSLILLAFLLFTAGCSNQPYDIKARQAELLGDAADIETLDLTLDEAISRAMAANVDLRVSALEVLAAENNTSLEKLAAMPEFTLAGGYQGRSNEGASSSRSLLTGRQSLEPSVSADQYRKTLDLDMRWNLLNVVQTVYRSKIAGNTAKAAAERHAQVEASILRDVQAAYGRAFVAQEQGAALEDLLAQANVHLDKMSQARADDLLSMEEEASGSAELIRAMQNAQDLKQQAMLAETELKGLLSLPQHVDLILHDPGTANAGAKNLLSADIKALEAEAVDARPEMREARLAMESAGLDMRREILESVPGAELFMRLSRDSNSFLEDSRWASFSLTIAENLTSLFTLPARYRAAKNTATLEQERALALSVAVITQVHLARHRLALAGEAARLADKEAKALGNLSYATQKKREEGFASGQESLIAGLQAQSAGLRAGLARVEAQDALVSMRMTLGRPATGGTP